MVKTAESRLLAESILNKWVKVKDRNDTRPISIGRVFKQDPYDCGNTKCVLCHNKYSSTKPRQKNVNLFDYLD